MIKNSDFKEALDYLMKQSTDFKASCNFELAYLHHRMGQNQMALSVFKDTKKCEDRDDLLLAQIYYKLGQYKLATDHYLKATKTGIVPQDDKADFITNILACSANDVT